MPVILDVFTLSHELYTKKKTTNVIGENNFPVTPPCSPPLPRLEQFSGMQSRPNECNVPFYSNGLTTALKKSTTMSNVNNIRCPVKNVRQSVIDGAHILPTTFKEFIDHGNYTLNGQMRRTYDVNGGAKIEDPELNVASSSMNNTVSCGNRMRVARKLKTQLLENSSVIELTGKPSYSTVQSVGESENVVDDSHELFLSPQDIKVLQLKRKLQEQEAALKKLRANHRS